MLRAPIANEKPRSRKICTIKTSRGDLIKFHSQDVFYCPYQSSHLL